MTRPFLAIAIASAIAPAAFAADTSTDTTYTLRDKIVGSMIPKDVVSASVPFDRRYEELTPEQKAVLWRDYESPKADDETPFPDSGLRHLAVPLMKLAERDGSAGPLLASAEVDSQGHARSVTIYKSPSAALSELVQSLLAQESYRPARCGGQACTMTFMLRLEFLQTKP